MTISNKESALLGLLCEKSMHPYEVEKEVKYRDMRYWTDLSMSSIYKVLRKLEEKDYVVSQTNVTDKNRVTKIYTVTESGKRVMSENVKTLLSKWTNVKTPIDLAFSNMYLLDKEQIKECLTKYEKSLNETLKGYKDLEKFLQDSNCPIGNLQLAKRPQELLKGEIKWLSNFKNEL
jgi:DNA-binding PadR family transcriptional regulator